MTPLARGGFFFAIALLSVGCDHSSRTLKMRTALDAWQPAVAIKELDKELGVKNDRERPKKLDGDKAILVLDRATLQQALTQYELSEGDYQAADKAIDMLDLSHNAGDSIGKYIFSDSVGRYVAPPYEKLLINTLNILNYLELNDLSGARVEARRLAIMHKYYKDRLHQNNAAMGLGGLLAGFVFEQSGDANEALHYYDDALATGSYPALSESIARAMMNGSYETPRLRAAAASAPANASGDSGELLLVIGYGRVPHKIAERMPIGLALTAVSGSIHPSNVSAANKLAAQGLVTWVNFPTLAPAPPGGYGTASATVDGAVVNTSDVADLAGEARREWKTVEAATIVSAITRLVTRYAAGEAARAAAGSNELIGVLASLATQGILTALDTPDTRSWETLPARVSVARITVPAGRRRVVLSARGVTRTQEVDIQKNGWGVVTLMALR